jgi:hypothetical protein
MQRERSQCFIQVEGAVVDRMRAMRRTGRATAKSSAAGGGNKTLMPDDGYMYDVEQSGVPAERRSALRRFRERRRLWLSWLHTDEVHTIWPTLHTMMWTDVAFRTLTAFMSNEENALNNPLS